MLMVLGQKTVKVCIILTGSNFLTQVNRTFDFYYSSVIFTHIEMQSSAKPLSAQLFFLGLGVIIFYCEQHMWKF